MILILSLPSLLELKEKSKFLKKPLFCNAEASFSLPEGELKLYLDINQNDIVMNAGVLLSTSDFLTHYYAELFCESLLKKNVFELKRYTEGLFLKSLDKNLSLKLEPLFPFLNPFFFLLERALEEYTGEALGIKKIFFRKENLLCRCMNIYQEELLNLLPLKRGDYKKAVTELDIGMSCGSCLKESFLLYEKYLAGSYFLEGKSYVEWAVELDQFFKDKFLNSLDYKDYTFEMISFENLLLKIKVYRGKLKLNRLETQKVLADWLKEKSREIKISIIF